MSSNKLGKDSFKVLLSRVLYVLTFYFTLVKVKVRVKSKCILIVFVKSKK